ncbi:MAG: SDR family oxidoreductase [Candidatus Dormibacteraeota bacterium]|uniref:SDR family oxidoreductase n=1 Tax=Candidatus Amunia macphersoniae TaxID=3127014 RepID=A0A934NAA2_9BACT|nr:SDR family oxidoreductase [Candidatus Dormibacteraeota bacterium]
MNLDGKVAVVTGSGRGIGRAYALALAEAGCAVVINDIDPDVAEQTVHELNDAGHTAVAEVVAVGSAEAADKLVQRAVESFEGIDIMCTNAGLLRDKVLWKMTDEDFDAVIETHMRGTFTCARAAAVRMREQGRGGRIVVVSSWAGQRGNFGQTNYAGAKAGIAAFARTWAMELARAEITVNAIVPNALTRMIASIPGMAEMVESAEKGQPLPDMVRKQMGMGMPEDVAPLLVFLASDAAKGITGQCIGLGGDKLSLWSHPQEIAAAYRDGGWTADAIAEVWSSSVGAQPQTYGIPFLGGGG